MNRVLLIILGAALGVGATVVVMRSSTPNPDKDREALAEKIYAQDQKMSADATLARKKMLDESR